MDHPQGILRTGDRATVQFEFISHPEFVKEGMKLLFREGKTKVSASPRIYPRATELNVDIGPWSDNTSDVTASVLQDLFDFLGWRLCQVHMVYLIHYGTKTVSLCMYF
jgi:hypothetical protein